MNFQLPLSVAHAVGQALAPGEVGFDFLHRVFRRSLREEGVGLADAFGHLAQDGHRGARRRPEVGLEHLPTRARATRCRAKSRRSPSAGCRRRARSHRSTRRPEHPSAPRAGWPRRRRAKDARAARLHDVHRVAGVAAIEHRGVRRVGPRDQALGERRPVGRAEPLEERDLLQELRVVQSAPDRVRTPGAREAKAPVPGHRFAARDTPATPRPVRRPPASRARAAVIWAVSKTPVPPAPPLPRVAPFVRCGRHETQFEATRALGRQGGTGVRASSGAHATATRFDASCRHL